jgi:hypothetical protein
MLLKLKLQMTQLNDYQQEVNGFMRKNFDIIIIVLIVICVLLLLCCVILLYMVLLYKNELNQNKKGGIIYNSNNNSNKTNEIMNISSPEIVDINTNPNNLKLFPTTSLINVTPINPLENESINDITMYNTYNSKNNKKFISINSEDNILSNNISTPRRTFDTISNINDYLTHSYSYNNNDRVRELYQYHQHQNNISFNNNNSSKRFPSLKKPKPLPLFERQNSITSTIGSVTSMIKRHYSIRSKSYYSSSNSKIPSILIQNNIPLHFINEELDNTTPSIIEHSQSVNSSITENNQNTKPRLNYLSSSSNKIKFDEDLPITDILIPSSLYSSSSKTVLCNNSYENYIYNDSKNEEFVNTINNIELNNMYKENYDSNRIFPIGYNTKTHEESIYSLSSYSGYSDNISYNAGNIVEEPETITNNHCINSDRNLEKLNMNSLDISTLNIEYKKEE